LLQSLKHFRVNVYKRATLEPIVLASVVIDGIGEKRLSRELRFLLWSIPTGAVLVRLNVKRVHAQFMTVMGGALPLLLGNAIEPFVCLLVFRTLRIVLHSCAEQLCQSFVAGRALNDAELATILLCDVILAPILDLFQRHRGAGKNFGTQLL
jgi:hypothetical protein